MDKTQKSMFDGSFQVEKNKYSLEENIWLDFTIENKSKKTVYVFFQKENPENLNIKIKETKGYIKHLDKKELGVSLVPEYQLKYEEQINTKYLLNSFLEFKKKGIYEIMISLDVEYNLVSIQSDQSKEINKIETITSIISLEITE
ncbi:hypothetical protein [Aquimarina sp. 2201CG14-23]|uniref:hypothetical protein n=1 Tax=Aquimarina mycalae TaxID=3040073 RepID=UPI002477E517|nr:hypothetical protein [Aquimarina sp. 2201CG14-23]MDH7444131.1 hypothetical protein [Aquimarina sp. 2201CG14-23]